ncbi:MAG: Crp/Fnr family transcriptional regulator [Candidatus Eisenbacteria bacterium]|nr:Crp/Fnr family transcriptional regulator [Candidatus Eisenbacteria bacterium]
MTRERDDRPATGTSRVAPGVSEDLLKSHGSRLIRVAGGTTVFEAGDSADHFHVLKTGRVRMVSMSDKGREFTQGWFEPGESFGEPPFFAQVPYPATAVAEMDSTVWKCARADFLRLLQENPAVHLALTQALSRRLVYKALMLGEIAIEEAEHRLATLFRYLRRIAVGVPSADYRIPLTRQQLADMTGLRVETVIRSVKSMESRGVLAIVGGRIIWNGKISGGTNKR